jgi:hypothetical protein
MCIRFHHSFKALCVPGEGMQRDRPTREARLEAASQAVSNTSREKCPSPSRGVSLDAYII